MDIGEVFGAPALSKAVAAKSNSLNVFNSGSKKARSMTGPQAVRYSDADLMTGSPRPPSRGMSRMIRNKRGSLSGLFVEIWP